MKKLPHRQELMKPILRAITDLGGSASVDEIREKVIQNLEIEDNLANIEHKSARAQADGRTELEYQLAWARTTLKELGFLENSTRGIWRLIRDAQDFDILAKKEAQSSENKLKAETRESDWRGEMVKILIEKLTPSAFERLIQLVLRETGFVQVDVTGRTGDGGIDGRGIAKINGILSFHVVFQCKRYKGAVPASQIRDFRGAMQGRADKGLFITTGYFTRDALKEAVRDGAVAIDLVDGEKLADKLKELRLGVRIENVEKITIDEAWIEKV